MVAERTASVKVTRSPGLNVVGSAVSESAGGPSPPLWHAWQLSVTIPPARAAADVVRPSKSDMPSASATIDFKFGQPFCRRRLTAASVHQLLQGTVVQELILSRKLDLRRLFRRNQATGSRRGDPGEHLHPELGDLRKRRPLRVELDPFIAPNERVARAHLHRKANGFGGRAR